MKFRVNFDMVGLGKLVSMRIIHTPKGHYVRGSYT